MHIPEDILLLIEKYQSGTATAEERLRLNRWYHSFEDGSETLFVNENVSEQQLADRIRASLLTTIHQTKEPAIRTGHRKKLFAAAAAILVFFCAGTYFLISTTPVKQNIASKPSAGRPSEKDIAPGGNKAVLTLADGSTIVLDSIQNGTISLQGNVDVQKLANGLLTYSINGKRISENDQAFYNTISTPRGGQYHVTLADGTEVWLNAASSIRFPVLFTGPDRKVEVTGETYFEVAKNKAMPFKVKAGLSEIEVVGTHFNVNAYADEPAIKTTLLEGAVKISAPVSVLTQAPQFLKPGQQAGINEAGKISLFNNADLEEVMAWKNGRFHFKSADLKSILRQISRWYDVDIEYQGNVNLHFTGQLTRNEYVSRVFEKLALTGEVHFRIEGKQIIVSP